MESILALLTIIIKRYSNMSIQHLFDCHLFVDVYFFTQCDVALHYLSNVIELHKSKIKVLANLQTNLVYVKIHYKKYCHLAQLLLTQIQNCVCVYEDRKTQDNIFSKFKQQKSQSLNKLEGVLINVKRTSISKVKEQFETHLSICELFHSHTNLVLSLNEIKHIEQLQIMKHKTFQDLEDDQNNFLEEAYFCKIFSSRGSKATLDDISEFCDVKRFLWGQLLTFTQGIDGLIIWNLKDSFPILEDIKMDHTDRSLKLCEYSNGKLIFKCKGKTQLKNDELNFHVVILNFKQVYAKNRKQILQGLLQNQIKKFKNLKTKTKQELQLEEDLEDIEQLCVNLSLDSYPLMRWLFFDEKKFINQNDFP